MSASVRFWVVFTVLLAATAGLHLGWHGEEVPLARPLATFPMELGALRGSDLPLEDWQVQAVQVDDYLSRVYRDLHAPAVYLYVGYYKSQRAGQTVHTPRNCMPGSGWQPVAATELTVDLPHGQRGAVNFIVIEKGLDRQVVLYWYQAHGRVVANEYWAKFHTVLDAIKLNRTDATLVRVSTPVRDNEGKARERALAFAQQTLVGLEGLIPR